MEHRLKEMEGEHSCAIEMLTKSVEKAQSRSSALELEAVQLNSKCKLFEERERTRGEAKILEDEARRVADETIARVNMELLAEKEKAAKMLHELQEKVEGLQEQLYIKTAEQLDVVAEQRMAEAGALLCDSCACLQTAR